MINNWSRIYLARFRRPKDFDPGAFEMVFEDELERWDDDTMRGAMQWMQSPGQDWGQYPTAKQLVVAYCCFLGARNAPTGEVLAARDVADKENMLGMCKNGINKVVARYASDDRGIPQDGWREIWDLICYPDDNDCRELSAELDQWAIETIGFDRAYLGRTSKYVDTAKIALARRSELAGAA